MIVLENGDKWIIDTSEIRDADYLEACKGNLPLTEIKDFVERLCKSYNCDNDREDRGVEHLTPCKLTDLFAEGYWDSDFDAFGEILGSVALSAITHPWARVYRMPWNTVIVVFIRADSGGYDIEIATKTYDSYDCYLESIRTLFVIDTTQRSKNMERLNTKMPAKDKERKITIQITLTVNPKHIDLEDFLLYLPEKLTGCLCDAECVLDDELYDEDVTVHG